MTKEAWDFFFFYSVPLLIKEIFSIFIFSIFCGKFKGKLWVLKIVCLKKKLIFFFFIDTFLENMIITCITSQYTYQQQFEIFKG